MDLEVNIKKTIHITPEDIDDIMCCALEGGITYWCSKAEVIGEYLGEYASEQISRGGTLKLYDEDGQAYELTKAKLLNGIKLAIEQDYYPHYHWHVDQVLDGCQIDGEVADAIVQLALFENVIYG